MERKWIIITAAVSLLAAFLAWLFVESAKPLPGEKLADLGREHINIGTDVKYESNPPTSGKHYADWIRAGIYETPKDDRNLVHSLEHGYIIMYYRCSEGPGKTQNASPSASEDCQARKDQLAKIYEKKDKRKLIVVPRSDLDTNFALTAWTYLDKFDAFDSVRIEKFIDAHRNQGPERTME